jgi:phosphatidylglycerophosphate synthase
MNLHRIETKTQWQHLKPHERNSWQRIAEQTKAIITPANIISLGGLALVIGGLMQLNGHYPWLGIMLIIIGRLCDLADGWIAELTGTKSFIGETLDATIDKISTIITIVVLGSTNIVPWTMLAALLLPHLVIPVIIFIQRQRGYTTHASRLGKLSMAGVWISLGGFLLIFGLDDAAPAILPLSVYIVTAFTALSSLVAAIGYIRNPSK